MIDQKQKSESKNYSRVKILNNFKSKILSHNSLTHEFIHDKELLDNTLTENLKVFATTNQIKSFNKLRGSYFNRVDIEKQLNIIEELNNKLISNNSQ